MGTHRQMHTPRAGSTDAGTGAWSTSLSRGTGLGTQASGAGSDSFRLTGGKLETDPRGALSQEEVHLGN